MSLFPAIQCRILLLICLAIFSAPFTAQNPPPVNISGILSQIRAQRQATDFKASGRLVRVSPSGQRTTYQITIRAKAFGETLKVFFEVTQPQASRVRLLLQ